MARVPKMPEKYQPEAIEECRRLYVKHGGDNHAAIEAGMRKQYPSWKRSNLYDRPATKKRGEQLGWINRYGFDNSLKLYAEKLVESVNDDEQDLYLGIKHKRKQLQQQTAGADATKELLWLYRDMCRLEIEARKNLDLTRDNLETFVSGYEKLLIWLGEIDPAAVKLLVKHGERLTEMAQAHYGKPEDGTAEEIGDGAGPGEDEGGQQQSSGRGLDE